MIFKKISGERIENLSEYLKSYLSSRDGEIEIYIGCDSLPPRNKMVSFITAIVIYDIGHGAHVIYKKDKSDKCKAMYDRLWREIELTVEVATYLRDNNILEYKTKNGIIKSISIEIHADLNPDSAHKSNAVYLSAMGYVKSLGFNFVPKPTAFAATYMADSLVRSK